MDLKRKDSIHEILHKIKHSRLKPVEVFLLDLVKGLKEYRFNDYPDVIYYVCSEKILFEYCIKNNMFYYDEDFMVYLTILYKTDNIKETIENIVCDALKLKAQASPISSNRWEKIEKNERI